MERLSELSRGAHGKGGSGLPRKTASVFRFPTSSAAGKATCLESAQQNWMGKMESHLPCFGIETGKQFMSESDANHFLGFAGLG